MSLFDHLRELRYRFLMSMIGILAVALIAIFFQRELLGIVRWPIDQAVIIFNESRPSDRVEMVTEGVTAGFSLYFRVVFVAGFIAACPIWLFHLWRFIVPALGEAARRTARQFLYAAIPLFLAGVAMGYSICPRGFAMLLNFNPPSVTNLNDMGTFMNFELRLLLVFGLAFQLPVLLVSLNRLRIISGQALGKFRGPAVVLCALFSAIATPTADALTMMALMIPMVAMYEIAEILCRINDKRRAARDAGIEPIPSRFSRKKTES
ncbi:MAG: twin-arginine translocase subunit TatC [Propionibacteriaceae bacterium]|jgi:sec-independent protein translocase protein TatC|nr:twin-arginine translocase subunit TatC [Propionibacteriaceae bacterium]